MYAGFFKFIFWLSILVFQLLPCVSDLVYWVIHFFFRIFDFTVSLCKQFGFSVLALMFWFQYSWIYQLLFPYSDFYFTSFAFGSNDLVVSAQKLWLVILCMTFFGRNPSSFRSFLLQFRLGSSGVKFFCSSSRCAEPF